MIVRQLRAKRRVVLGALAIAAVALVAASIALAGSSAKTSSQPTLTNQKSPVPLGKILTRGPNGEVPVWYTKVNLTPAELKTIRAGRYKAAFLNHTTSPFMSGIIRGSLAAFKAMKIKMVAVTNANFSAAKQAQDVQNVLPLHPNIILGLAIDPVSAASYFQPAVKQGVKLVFLSNKPNGYVDGKQDVGVVTYDVSGLGTATADAMCSYLGGHGNIGYMYYKANFWITNQREAAFLKELGQKCPGVTIVDKAPMADPAQAQQITTAMLTAHSDIQALFIPWDSPPAEGAAAALRALHKSDVKIFTIDLGGTNAIDMAQCGNVVEETSTLAYQIGYTAAIEGALGVLKAHAPKMAVVPAFPITSKNLATGWPETYRQPLPGSVVGAAKGHSCPTTAG